MNNYRPICCLASSDDRNNEIYNHYQIPLEVSYISLAGRAYCYIVRFIHL